MEPRKQGERQGHIPEQMQYLEKSAHRYNELLDQLDERIDSVLRAPAPNAEGKSDKADEALVPHASGIRNLRRMFDIQNNRLEDYIDRIEL